MYLIYLTEISLFIVIPVRIDTSSYRPGSSDVPTLRGIGLLHSLPLTNSHFYLLIISDSATSQVSTKSFSHPHAAFTTVCDVPRRPVRPLSWCPPNHPLSDALHSHSAILCFHQLAVNFCAGNTLRSIKTGSHYEFLVLAVPMFHGRFLCTSIYPINGSRLTLAPSVACCRYYKCCILPQM